MTSRRSFFGKFTAAITAVFAAPLAIKARWPAGQFLTEKDKREYMLYVLGKWHAKAFEVARAKP